MDNIITEDLLPALEGAIPAIIATASSDGIPNATYIWQVFYVDERHVALSRQYFNKTSLNLLANPIACLLLTSPVTHFLYKLLVRFVEAQQDGPVFEKMVLQMEIIAGLQHNTGSFELQSADIYEIIQIERLKLL